MLAHLWRKVGKKPAIPSEGLLVQMLTARRPILRLRYGGMALWTIREDMEFAFGEVSLLTNLEVGTFPDYHLLIPKVFYSQVTVMGDALERALRQVLPVAGSDVIRLGWGDGKLVLSAQGEEAGEAEAMVWAETGGEPGRIAFSHNYLTEYLKGEERPVTIQTSGPSSPGVFTSTDPTVVVMMPMFVQWGPDGVGTQEETVAEEAPANPQGVAPTGGEKTETAVAPEVPEAYEAPVPPDTEDSPKPKGRRGRKRSQ